MKKIPVNEPVISAEAKRNVAEALESGWISSLGPFVERFEHAFADFLGVTHAATTSNGTTALHLALAALDIGPGDEVILPTFTMIAPVCAVLYTGATPIFVDAEPDTFNMDVTQVAAKITPKTKVILPVHLYGHSVNMDPLLELAGEHGLMIVEDAAEAHGAFYKGRKCGSLGHLGCFSFYANKIITTGEGGMVVTSDDALALRLRSLRDLAHSKERRFWHEELGFNYRMTNMQAAVGVGELQHIDAYLAKKDWMATEYEKRLEGIPGLHLPVTKPYGRCVHWMYAVRVTDPFPLSRDALRTALAERDIETRDVFYSAAAQPVVRRFVPNPGTFPVAERLSREGLYLPSGLALTAEQLARVCTTLRELAGA